MYKISSIELGIQLCKILKLDANCIKEMHIHLIAGEEVIITTIQNIDTENKITDVFKSYSLIENNGTKDETE
jgi:hypothetical protein